jgi:hypothetical protein
MRDLGILLSQPIATVRGGTGSYQEGRRLRKLERLRGADERIAAAEDKRARRARKLQAIADRQAARAAASANS